MFLKNACFLTSSASFSDEPSLRSTFLRNSYAQKKVKKIKPKHKKKIDIEKNVFLILNYAIMQIYTRRMIVTASLDK